MFEILDDEILSRQVCTAHAHTHTHTSHTHKPMSQLKRWFIRGCISQCSSLIPTLSDPLYRGLSLTLRCALSPPPSWRCSVR